MKQFLKTNPILFLFFISTLAVLFFSIYTNNLMEDSSAILENFTGMRLQVLATEASQLATVKELDEFHTAKDMEKPLYAEIKRRMAGFNDSWGLLYTYFMRLHEGKLQYIIDNVLDPDAMDGPGSLMDMYNAPKRALEGQIALHGIGDNLPEWANIMAAYVPIFDDEGKVYCIVGVDLIDGNIVDLRSSIRNMNILQIFSLLLAAATGGIGIVLYRNKALASNKANLAKSQFLSSMSHEMRTPMNAIIGMTNIANSSNDLEKKNYCIAKISDASTHLLGIINDILDMSKIEASKFELSFSEFSFADMLDKIVRTIHLPVEEKQQTLQVTSDQNIPPSIISDEQHLSRAIANLLGNAIKFTPEKGSITLKAQKISEDAGDCVIQIDVSDTGIGISNEQKKQLFKSFTQADNSTSRKFGGTGLGLVISKRIIELLQGKIWIESELGKGSTFSFVFHAKRGNAIQSPKALNTGTDTGTPG